jgi:hypothetical protein
MPRDKQNGPPQVKPNQGSAGARRAASRVFFDMVNARTSSKEGEDK